jgi:ABC-type antimicrobial peptide transport system permease subunit
MKSRLRPNDLVALGSLGFRTRRLRASLSSLGVAIGVAAIVGVVGVSSSSGEDLLAQLDQLSSLLTVTASPAFVASNVELPRDAVSMVRRIGAVSQASAIGTVSATVRRTDRIQQFATLGITVFAAQTDLLVPLRGGVAEGGFLNGATAHYPAVVLGSIAANRLGIDRTGIRIYIGGHWFAVVGILKPLSAAPEIDRSALVGFPVAESLLGFRGSPSTIYIRADPDQMSAVRNVLPFTVYPARPEAVEVSRPSDALAARAAARLALQGLLLGLSALALLVAGIGVANVMVISVLERRTEIGVRRALGASRRHIGLQFFAEAIVISFTGSVGGLGFGSAFVLFYARIHGWPAIIPLESLVLGFAAAISVGVVAGIYPAIRAARLMPSEALRAA